MHYQDLSGLTTLSLMAGLVLCGFSAHTICNSHLTPKTIEMVQDLNKDGVEDIVLENNNGDKIPMYGIKEGDKTIYVSASELMRRYSSNKNLIQSNLNSIESKLNK